MSNVYLREPNGRLKKLPSSIVRDACSLRQYIYCSYQIPIEDQRLTHNGHDLLMRDTLPCQSNQYEEIRLLFRLVGGKGGFGSLLRAAGKVSRTSNYLACRDLSGRRIRYIRQEEEFRQWIAEQKVQGPVDVKEVHEDFRHIKKTGRQREKRMCYRGVDCPYKYKCRFRHPDDEVNVLEEDSESDDELAPKNRWGGSGKRARFDPRMPDVDRIIRQEDRQVVLQMGLLHAKRKEEFEEARRNRKKKAMVLGPDAEFLSESDDSGQGEVATDAELREKSRNARLALMMERLLSEGQASKHHDHNLRYSTRGAFDWVACDMCGEKFEGPSWHCCDGCDFDLCEDCVEIDTGSYFSQIRAEAEQRVNTLVANEESGIFEMEDPTEIGRRRKKQKKKRQRAEGKEDGDGDAERGAKRVRVGEEEGQGNEKQATESVERRDLATLRGEIDRSCVTDPNEIIIDPQLLIGMSRSTSSVPS